MVASLLLGRRDVTAREVLRFRRRAAFASRRLATALRSEGRIEKQPAPRPSSAHDVRS